MAYQTTRRSIIDKYEMPLEEVARRERRSLSSQIRIFVEEYLIEEGLIENENY